MFRAEVRDERVNDMVADDYAILFTIALEQLKMLEILGLLIDVNLAIVFY